MCGPINAKSEYFRANSLFDLGGIGNDEDVCTRLSFNGECGSATYLCNRAVLRSGTAKNGVAVVVFLFLTLYKHFAVFDVCKVPSKKRGF